MDNLQDKKQLLQQLNQLKSANQQSREYLAAIELLMVDDNNGRIKEESYKKELQNITTNIESVNKSISAIENSLNR